MTKFKVLYALRTDGELETRLPNGKTEPNAPTAEQLSKVLKVDAKSGAKIYDYYRELTDVDTKHIDWRLKLAALYAKHCGDESMKANPTEFILAQFPEGYRLFEHIKTREDASSDKAGKKGHAGGGHDRQDAYLYGYPGGRKKRFRSPAEFFHHLKYMIDPECKDWRDCACKFCAPDEVQPSKNKKGKKETIKSDKTEKDASAETKQKAVNVQVLIPAQASTPQMQQIQQIQPQTQPVSTSGASQPGIVSYPALQQSNSRLPTLAPNPIPKRAISKAKKELVFVNQTPPPVPTQPQMQRAQTQTPPQQAIRPQWIQAPAHPSHLNEQLDQSIVDWMQNNAPKEYQMYGAWIMARFPSQKEKDDLYRNLIDSLDYLVWLGANIPGYFPRKVSTIGPDGKPVNRGRQQPIHFQQQQYMPQSMYVQQTPVDMSQQMHSMSQQQRGMQIQQQVMPFEHYPQQYQGPMLQQQMTPAGYDQRYTQLHMTGHPSSSGNINSEQISEERIRIGDYLHMDQASLPPNNKP